VSIVLRAVLRAMLRAMLRATLRGLLRPRCANPGSFLAHGGLGLAESFELADQHRVVHVTGFRQLQGSPFQ